MSVDVSEIPLGGGENTSADAATMATSRAANLVLGPAGENSQRPGLVDYGVTGLTAPVIGLYQWRTWVIAVTTDRRVWALPQGSPTMAVALSDATAATQLPGAARPTFAEDGLPRVIIAGGNAPIYWNGAGFATALVTTGHTPAATHIAYLGQRLIANDISNPTLFFWSDIGDGAHQSWNAASFNTADASPDNVVAVTANLRELYIFGQRTIQVYAVGQDPLNPFDSLVTQQIGCEAPYSIVNIDGSWMFVDDKRRIVLSDGRSFTDLSADIATTLRGFSTVSDCWGYREDQGNQTNIGFVFPTVERELVLDVDKKAWFERDFYGSTGPGARPINCFARWDALNINLLGSSTAAAIYKSDATARNDLGQPLVMERITGWLDHGTRSRKRSVRIRSVIHRGTGGASGMTDKLEVRVANDGGPWDDWEQVDIGLAGDGEQATDAYPGGVFRRRRYHFRYSGTQEMSLLSAEEQFIECDS